MLDSSDSLSAAPVLPNPLREGLAEERVPEPAVMVIFGASGDLAHRKLLLDSPSDAELAVAALGARGRDPLFARCLGYARQLWSLETSTAGSGR